MLPSFSDENRKNRTKADTIPLTEDDAIRGSISDESAAGPSTSSQVRGPMILESVKSGGRPMELSELIYDPLWSPIERSCCKILAGFGILTCIATLIALTIGFVQVWYYIDEKRAMQNRGLFMVPNLSGSHGYLEYHIKDTVESKRWPKVLSYVKQMDDFLEEQKMRRFQIVDPPPVDFIDALNCSKQNNFGYDDKKPCFLIGFRNPGRWFPEIDEMRTLHRIRHSVGHTGGRSAVDVFYIPVVCRIKASFFDPQSDDDKNLFSYYPKGGLSITSFYFTGTAMLLKYEPFVASLMMIKINNMERVADKVISCSMYAENLNEFVGIKTIEFSPIDPEMMPYSE